MNTYPTAIAPGFTTFGQIPDQGRFSLESHPDRVFVRVGTTHAVDVATGDYARPTFIVTRREVIPR